MNMVKRFGAALVLTAVTMVAGCDEQPRYLLSDKLQKIMDRSRVKEQSFREVPNGMRGFILDIPFWSLVEINEAESVELLTAASFRYPLTEINPKGIRVRLMTSLTEGWLLGEVIRTAEGVRSDFALFDHNKAEALKEKGIEARKHET